MRHVHQLTSILTSEETSSTYTIPSPAHLVIIITILVHPSTTNMSICTQASQLLTRVLKVATPSAAKFDQVWNFSLNRKQHGGHGNSDGSEEDATLLNRESLFAVAEGPWGGH